jgi:hypothetical protein
MKQLPFFDRHDEIKRIYRTLRSADSSLIVIFGRRRCGKSRFLQQVVQDRDIYYLADTRETALQIKTLADEIAKKIPEFNSVAYPSWDSLFSMLNTRAKPGIALVLDEFPYLVQQYPPLTSIIQKLIDGRPSFHMVICGSSQRMMQGMALDSSSPVYGRATEIIKIQPLEAGWITKALAVKDIPAIEAYSVWGGVPRYWELAAQFNDLQEAVSDMVFDAHGVLHEEPQRLLLDDMRSATQPHSVLSLIANGCHRLSEIAGRLGKPGPNLSHPLNTLVELGYIRREVPFGESVKSTKRTLYALNDPFLLFWYRFVHPNRSALELGRTKGVIAECKRFFPSHVGFVWEELARRSTAFLEINGVHFKPGQRFWGPGMDGVPIEVDVVAESIDGKHVLFGEAKWEEKTDLGACHAALMKAAGQIPHLSGKNRHFVYWLKHPPKKIEGESLVIGPSQILEAMR